MITISIEQLGEGIPELITEVSQGGSVLITKDNKPFAEVVPVSERKERPGFGSLRGQIHMADDFDAPLDDIKDYME